MKGLSIAFAISLFVFAGVLSQILKRSGLLPSQLSAGERSNESRSIPVGFANYWQNNPNHSN